MKQIQKQLISQIFLLISFGAFSQINLSNKEKTLLDASIQTKVPNSFIEVYPSQDKLIKSKGNTHYYIDPQRGNDNNNGRSMLKAWKTFAKINALQLQPGDVVTIAPGTHDYTLKPTVCGNAKHPVIIRFMPGIHEFTTNKTLNRPWHISNSNDEPFSPKPCAILIENSQYLKIEGSGLTGKSKTLLMFGRMIFMINQFSENISYSNLLFDLKRPVVSEFRVVDVKPNTTIVQIAEGSTYQIKDGKFSWTGDLGKGWELVQEAIPSEGRCWRREGKWNLFNNAIASDLGNFKVKFELSNQNTDLKVGHQYQFRNTMRDMSTGLNARSKNIAFMNCKFLGMSNMAIISQFTENITFKDVDVAPPHGTIRTCPSWADAFHFSGCKGNILVENCLFSGMQDDPINVHGTHLRIIKQLSDNKILLRFMHPQTYGFAAFVQGDEIAVFNHLTLKEYEDNPHRKVTACYPNPEDTTRSEWIVEIDGKMPAFKEKDVIDNITWYPNFIARNNYITMNSCRGFLVTTRGTVLLEGNTFNRCQMPALLIESDAEGWFESGTIQNMIIRNNTFIGCNIEINPHVLVPNGGAVHKNIKIIDNIFKEEAQIVAHRAKKLVIKNNKTDNGKPLEMKIDDNCEDVVIQK